MVNTIFWTGNLVAGVGMPRRDRRSLWPISWPYIRSFSARSTSNDVYVAIIGLYKNGSVFNGSRFNSNSTSNAQFRGFGLTISATLDLSVGDYIEVFGNIYGTSPSISAEGQKEVFFGGYKIIE